MFAPCLAPIRRKMFISYVWIFALLLLHSRISGQMCFIIRHSIIARACFWRIIYTRKRGMLHTNLHLHCTQILFGNYFWWVIVLRTTRLMRHHGITHSWATRQILFGELISVKKHEKHQMITQNTFGNIAMTLWKMFGFLHGFRRISGAKSHLNLLNPCVESSWRRFETYKQLAWREKGNTRRLIETFKWLHVL